MPEWATWSIEEASKKTGYNREYLRRLIRLNKIEAVKFGPAYAIRRDSLLKYIEEAEQIDGRGGPRKR